MPKRLSTKAKRPTDVNQLMHHLGEQSTKEKEPEKAKAPTKAEISRFMAAMGRKGGKKSAKARMEKIDPRERSRIALRAAQTRWAKAQENRQKESLTS
jgi:hypothetical protein